MIFNAPLSEEKAERLMGLLPLTPASSVLDVGCGEGEFLIRLQRASGAVCQGIDIDSACVARANEKAEQSAAGALLRFQHADIQHVKPEKNCFDLAICIGSTHAFAEGRAAYATALSQMRDWVRPGGLLLLGEGYWKQSPAQEYLDFLGDPVGVYQSHEENIHQAQSLGLIPLYAAVSNQDEWDHFEWSFLLKAERRAQANPSDSVASTALRQVREWNQYYRKFGRTTMGFGFYLLATPT